MARISWGEATKRVFEVGLDRGVFYPQIGAAAPWNGLISVTEGSEGGEVRPFYMDGIKVMNLAGSEEFIASIESFYPPEGFDLSGGSAQISPGLFATQQIRQSFNMTYRSLLGNDVDGIEHGYKIHMVYNALASPSDVSHSTISDTAEAPTMSWNITTLPPITTGIRPTAHFVVDSTLASGADVTALEDILYGTDINSPRMATVSELLTIFGS